MLKLNQNCHAQFGKYRFDTSETLDEYHVEGHISNLEFKPIQHHIKNCFSFGAINDDTLEKMFKNVDMLEIEAPKTLREAEKIILK